jgi:hypothetical protein
VTSNGFKGSFGSLVSILDPLYFFLSFNTRAKKTQNGPKSICIRPHIHAEIEFGDLMAACETVHESFNLLLKQIRSETPLDT